MVDLLCALLFSLVMYFNTQIVLFSTQQNHTVVGEISGCFDEQRKQNHVHDFGRS